MKYQEFKKKQQDEFDKLPMKAAFGDKQFKEMMSEWGLTTSKDYHLFIEFGERSAKESEEFLSNDDNLVNALKYEFGNHECCLTFEFENGIIALGIPSKSFLQMKERRSFL